MVVNYEIFFLDCVDEAPWIFSKFKMENITLPPKYAANLSSIPASIKPMLTASYPAEFLPPDITEIIYRKYYLDLVLLAYPPEAVTKYILNKK